MFQIRVQSDIFPPSWPLLDALKKSFESWFLRALPPSSPPCSGGPLLTLMRKSDQRSQMCIRNERLFSPFPAFLAGARPKVSPNLSYIRRSFALISPCCLSSPQTLSTVAMMKGLLVFRCGDGVRFMSFPPPSVCSQFFLFPVSPFFPSSCPSN